MKVIGARIKTMTVEILTQDEDGDISVEEKQIEVGAGTNVEYREAVGTDCDQSFWIASNHPRLFRGKGMIASSVTPESPEEARDYKNTLIGLIRDGHAGVFATYDTDGTFPVK
jgi:hypothetical protein